MRDTSSAFAEGRVAWIQFFIAMARRTPEFQERVSFEKRHKDTFYACVQFFLGVTI